MKATLDRADLAQALAAISPAIPTRPTMPVLTAVVLTVDGPTMRLKATDFNITIERSIEITPGEDGTVLVSGLRLRDLVSKFTSPTVVMASDGDGLRITAGRSDYRLATMPPEEYPDTPVVPKKTGSTIVGALLMAGRVVSHAAKGDLEEITSGVTLEVQDGQLWTSATDRFRIAIQPIQYTGDTFRIRVLHSTFATLGKNMDGDVDLHVNDNVVCFRTAEASVTVRLLDGDGVRWQTFLDVVGEHPVTVNVEQLTGALDRLNLILEREKPIVVNIADGVASLAAADPLADGNEEVDVEGTGTPERFGLNPGYMREFLATVDTPAIELGTRADPKKPLRIRCLNSDGEPTDAVHILMPLRLKKDA